MSEELYNCAIVVKTLMGEIGIVEKTHLGYPDSIVTRLEVAVVIDRLRHGQAGGSSHGLRNYLLLRGYAPLGADREGAEERIMKLWNLMVDKLNANVTLDGTVSRSNLERGRLGHQTVAGVKCRTLDALLEAYLVQAERYRP